MHTLPNPRNQKELVIYTLLNPPKELSMGWFMAIYKTHKFSSRLSELELKFGTLVKKSMKPFTNRFKHSSAYMVYTPILSKKQYEDIYRKLQKEKA